MYNIEREDYECYDKVVTLEEISKSVDEEYNSMSDEEKYCRLRDNDPTFFQYCHTFMIQHKLDKVLINIFTNKCEKI